VSSTERAGTGHVGLCARYVPYRAYDRVVSIASILTKLSARHCRRVGKKRLRKLIWIGWYQILFLIAPLISSCSFNAPKLLRAPKNKMLGMSKEQVLAGMGAPPQRASAGQTEVWSYPSGGDMSTVSTASGSIYA
jgi:hypothetical protein